MDAKRGRWDFPEVEGEGDGGVQYWEPDMVLIEAKATGTPLTDELRATMVFRWSTIHRPRERTSIRGCTWSHPYSSPARCGRRRRRFAEEVIDECAAFPSWGAMTITATACPWHLLDTVKGVFFDLTATKKKRSLPIVHRLDNIIRG